MFAIHSLICRTATPWALTISLFATSLCLIAPQARAQVETFGDYNVHYSVFNSTFIDPDIAAAYDLVRAKDLAVINISITQDRGGEITYGVPARVTGQAMNLLQQGETLEFREISEGNVTYYLATINHTHEENLNFHIRIQPESRNTPFEVKFARKLYVEGR